MVQRRIYRPKNKDVAGRWRKLHNAELHHLNSSPNTIRMIKLRMMRWAGHQAHKRNAYHVFESKPQGRTPTRKIWA
jgi:hypothetical protein